MKKRNCFENNCYKLLIIRMKADPIRIPNQKGQLKQSYWNDTMKSCVQNMMKGYNIKKYLKCPNIRNY